MPSQDVQSNEHGNVNCEQSKGGEGNNALCATRRSCASAHSRIKALTKVYKNKSILQPSQRYNKDAVLCDWVMMQKGTLVSKYHNSVVELQANSADTQIYNSWQLNVFEC